jgi:hypothetical protein
VVRCLRTRTHHCVVDVNSHVASERNMKRSFKNSSCTKKQEDSNQNTPQLVKGVLMLMVWDRRVSDDSQAVPSPNRRVKLSTKKYDSSIANIWRNPQLSPGISSVDRIVPEFELTLTDSARKRIINVKCKRKYLSLGVQ